MSKRPFGHKGEGIFPDAPTSISPEHLGEDAKAFLEHAAMSEDQWRHVLQEVEEEEKRDRKKVKETILDIGELI